MNKRKKGRKTSTFRIDPEIAEQLEKAIALHGFTKSDLINNLLAEVLPILLETDMQKLMSKGTKRVGEAFKEMGEIIENADTKK